MLNRYALIARIRSDPRPVTLISAPAGFGKTVLARLLADAVGAAPVPGRPGAFDGPGWRIRDTAPVAELCLPVAQAVQVASDAAPVAEPIDRAP